MGGTGGVDGWSPTVCDGVARGGSGSAGAAPGVLAGSSRALLGDGDSDAEAGVQQSEGPGQW